MTSLRDVANITFYDRKTGKKIIETPINNFTNTKEVVSNIPYNNLIPFRIQFDDSSICYKRNLSGYDGL